MVTSAPAPHLSAHGRSRAALSTVVVLAVFGSGLVASSSAHAASGKPVMAAASMPVAGHWAGSRVVTAPAVALSAKGKRPRVIKGKVKKPNGKPLKGVWVYAFRKKVKPRPGREAMKVRTDEKGKYRFRDLRKGRYRILADGFPKLRVVKWSGGEARWGKAARFKPGRKNSTRVNTIRLERLPASELEKSIPARSPKSVAAIRGVPVDAWQPYVGQSKCEKDPQAGTVGVRDLIVETYGSDIPIGLNRACGSDKSEHYDGRALDWMVDSRDLVEGSKGDAFVRWLVKERKGEIGAMARRLGIMYIIWRGRSWAQYRPDGSWNDYLSCQKAGYRARVHDNICHRNHIHLSLTPQGAQKLTSWWTGEAWG